MNKKGVFFTFVAILVILLIISVVQTTNNYRYREKSFVIASRVSAMDQFLADTIKDLEREMFIGGYRSLLSMEKYLRMKQGFIDDVERTFAEVFVNGTANETAIDIMSQEGQGADFTSWSGRINEQAAKMDILVAFKINEFLLRHSSPWSVDILLDVEIDVNDSRGLSTWAVNKTFLQTIDIRGFEDPLYIINTQDRISNIINVTEIIDFVDDATNDTTNLENHLANSFYTNSTKAPSFLMRFEGNLSNSSFGIESMVNLEDFQKQNLEVKNKTVIDYIYFSNTTTDDWCNIDNMDSWFRIDKDHANFYEVDLLGKEECS